MLPSRATLERLQVWLHLAALLAGLGAGRLWPAAAESAEALLWPLLALLLLATFSQVPLTRIAGALRDVRLLGALLLGNFVLVPLLLLALWPLVPPDPAIRLGVLLVLLLPCTDWSISFTHLAGGNTAGLIAAVPWLLLLQFLLLPAYLWAFLGPAELVVLRAERLLLVFATIILLPLGLALLLERWAEQSRTGAGVMRAMGAWPAPLLAAVMFLIALGQGQALLGALEGFAAVAGVFALYLAGALALGLLLARGLGLPPASGTALTFSLGTRNSFVVLPIALAMPEAWATALVIVLQSMVELFGMLFFLRVVPWLFGR
jgi:ACR3 family arsenite transporter